MQAKLIAIVLGGALVGLTGCADVPQSQVDTAKQALDQAKNADAAEYAPDELRAAQDAQAALDNELQAQGERWALMRSYDKSIELATAAEQAAQKATNAAQEGKERVKQEATDAMNAVRASLADVSAMLDAAPRGKGTQADLAVLRTDLDGVQQALSEMEASFAAEQYNDAIAKASAAQQTVDTVRDEVTRATEMARGRRG